MSELIVMIEHPNSGKGLDISCNTIEDIIFISGIDPSEKTNI